ncbi:hypothetical protein RHGRI_030899 [Rhododendron griersonianum]|uniref:Uncharacterized protein n=1 Tax=Rhododendron griersonianum TaxID=479676 RepID=A0AAV6I8E3_9ERIC|nr:hypothetical protein RHGRI_030899 [Rhododendron griersonianum]
MLLICRNRLTSCADPFSALKVNMDTTVLNLTKRSNLMTWVNPDLGESGKELEVVQMPMEYILQQVALPGSGE